MKKSKRHDAEIARTKAYYQVSGKKWLRIKWVKDEEVR